MADEVVAAAAHHVDVERNLALAPFGSSFPFSLGFLVNHR